MKDEKAKLRAASSRRGWIQMHRELCSVIQLGIGFFFIFAAFNSQAFIVLPVTRKLSEQGDISKEDGYYSKSILYFTFMFSNLLAPPVIAKLGSKWSMVMGATTYLAYLLCFLHLKTWLYFSASALNGFGAAILWTANGVFLVECSRKENLGRNSSIMWTVMQTSLFAGATLLALFMGQESGLETVYKLVYTVFSFVAGIGVLTLALLPGKADPEVQEPVVGSLMSPEDGEQESPLEEPPLPNNTRSVKEVFVSTFQLAATKKMATMLVVFFFLGTEAVFSHGVYPASLAATEQFEYHDKILPYLIFSFGTGAITSGLLLSKKKSTLGNKWVVFTGSSLMIIAYTLAFFILPPQAALGKTDQKPILEPANLFLRYFLYLIPPLLLGLADSCWQTQVVTIVGGIWRDKDAPPAFACFKFFQAGAACFAYAVGSKFALPWILLFIISLVILSTISFFLVHAWAFKEQTTISNRENNHH